ncbi:metallophosphoesterase family protein [Endozoicomonas euniceicola]|uniref:Metallophosphoesterase n=1 Tax=Endozoicomonas euniceicola TaxID=1234143 RepID=A0ABY6GUB4_9GAMM|nr:metallophosphoesterase [Endozoicomonas euniceicola]UYM15671.1 metallophosphoesterase [Endozoicomonas euniceicola]
MEITKLLSRRSFLAGTAKAGTIAAAAPLLGACTDDSKDQPLKPDVPDFANMKVALLADVHFHDVFGDYEFNGYNSEVTIRSMQDSVGSTRMFNENYFAFISALEKLGEQGIKYICLLGDFTDDGQMDTLAGFNRVVKPYIQKYGFEFFIANGNHDPVSPSGAHQTKRFLRHDGASVEVTSDFDRGFTPDSIVQEQHKTNRMFGAGYEHMFDVLADYGFQSKPSYLHYETPWGSEQFAKRGLNITGSDGTTKWCPDATYLAEPENGLWICSVDMNIYTPKENGHWDHRGIGWEEGKTHKKAVFDWLKDVTRRAEKQGKALIIFSHYPVTEYLNKSANDFYYVFNDASYNNTRIPTPDTADQAITAGVKVQFAGHIHVNDTAVHHNEQGTLVNVQTPSLAAYTPSYKLVKPHGPDLFEIETHTLKNVRDYNKLFPYYRREMDWREWAGADVSWKIMLEAKDYRDLMFKHLEVLIDIRLKNKWGEDMKTLFEARTPLFWLMVLSELKTNINSNQILSLLSVLTNVASDNDVISQADSLNIRADMTQAISAVYAHIAQYGMNRQQMMGVSFNEICLATLYQRNGDELALEDLSYKLLIPVNVATNLFAKHDSDGDLNTIDWEHDYVGGDPKNGGLVKMKDCDLNTIKSRFAALARMYHQFKHAQPADHFFIDLKRGIVNDMAGNKLLI